MVKIRDNRAMTCGTSDAIALGGLESAARVSRHGLMGTLFSPWVSKDSEREFPERVAEVTPRFLTLTNLIILMAGVCAMLVGCAGKTSLSEVSLDRMLDEAEKRAFVVNRFRADFVKTRHSGIFNRALTVEGRIVFQKPDMFKLTTTGDVTVEILSDGKMIALTHDKKEQEILSIEGGRDLSAFADPLMVLMHGLGKGALKRYPILNQVQQADALMVELGPGKESKLERIDRVFLWLGDNGGVKRVRLLFTNGDVDDIRFRSWTLLARNDPEILDLKRRIQELPHRKDPRERTADSLRDGLLSKN